MATSRLVVVPEELDGAKVLKYALVSDDVEPTGATRHFANGVELGSAAALAIARYEGGHQGFYLFYLDAEGAVATDTFHESVEARAGGIRGRRASLVGRVVVQRRLLGCASVHE